MLNDCIAMLAVLFTLEDCLGRVEKLRQHTTVAIFPSAYVFEILT